MPAQLERDKVCDILYQQGLLSREQNAWLARQEAEEQMRARTKKPREGQSGTLARPPDIV